MYDSAAKFLRRDSSGRTCVYVFDGENPVFRRLRRSDTWTLKGLIQKICHRVGAYLERQDLLVRDNENTCLKLESTDASAMDDLLGHSISCRIAVGPHVGRKAFTLQTIPAWEECAATNGRSRVAEAVFLHHSPGWEIRSSAQPTAAQLPAAPDSPK